MLLLVVVLQNRHHVGRENVFIAGHVIANCLVLKAKSNGSGSAQPTNVN